MSGNQIVKGIETIGTYSVVKQFFGPIAVAGGNAIADKINAWRYKNQLKTLEKTLALLNSKKLNHKNFGFKTLLPLLDYISLDEEETKQNMWANVIANIESGKSDNDFNNKCIEILKEISVPEILILEYMYNVLKEKKHLGIIAGSGVRFQMLQITGNVQIDKTKIQLYIERLVSYGILKYINPQLKETSKKKVNPEYSKRGFQVPTLVEVSDYKLEFTEAMFHFTQFGLYFVKLCKYES